MIQKQEIKLEAINAYNRLRDQDGVVAVIGGTLSGETLAMKDIMVSDNMPVSVTNSNSCGIKMLQMYFEHASLMTIRSSCLTAATTLGAKLRHC